MAGMFLQISCSKTKERSAKLDIVCKSASFIMRFSLNAFFYNNSNAFNPFGTAITLKKIEYHLFKVCANKKIIYKKDKSITLSYLFSFCR